MSEKNWDCFMGFEKTIQGKGFCRMENEWSFWNFMGITGLPLFWVEI